MAIRSKEFVGIAEGIKAMNFPQKVELKASEVRFLNYLVQNGRWRIRSRTLRRVSLQHTKIPMKTATPIMVAYQLLKLKSMKPRVSCQKVEGQLDTANGELSQSQAELESVMEEKARTLF